MKIVISVGGSIIAPTSADVGYIGRFSEFVRELSEGNSLGVVVGGGKIARDYINASRKFNASEFFCDLAGICASRLNAMLLTSAFKGNGVEANKEPVLTIDDA